MHDLFDRQSIVFALALLARFATETGQVERAGRLWGAIEAEADRAPVGYWERHRDEFAALVVHESPEFEQAREVGSRLSLDEAVAYALGP